MCIFLADTQLKESVAWSTLLKNENLLSHVWAVRFNCAWCGVESDQFAPGKALFCGGSPSRGL